MGRARKYFTDEEKRLGRLKKRKERRDRNRIFVYEHLLANPCVDCGEKDPVVLEFDHTRDKENNVSMMIKKSSIKNIQAEIKKCKVRCSNCHRTMTAKRAKWWVYRKHHIHKKKESA